VAGPTERPFEEAEMGWSHVPEVMEGETCAGPSAWIRAAHNLGLGQAVEGRDSDGHVCSAPDEGIDEVASTQPCAQEELSGVELGQEGLGVKAGAAGVPIAQIRDPMGEADGATTSHGEGRAPSGGGLMAGPYASIRAAQKLGLDGSLEDGKEVGPLVVHPGPSDGLSAAPGMGKGVCAGHAVDAARFPVHARDSHQSPGPSDAQRGFGGSGGVATLDTVEGPCARAVVQSERALVGECLGQPSAQACAEFRIDANKRTKLDGIGIPPRIIKNYDDFAVPQIKSDFPGAGRLKEIVYRRTRGATIVEPGTPPRVALGIIQEVLDAIVALGLYCMGLPECNGNEIRWRWAAQGGPVLDFAFQLKQGSILDVMKEGDGKKGPSTVRGLPVNPRFPCEAPGGYPKGGTFSEECTRMAIVFLLENKREWAQKMVVLLLDCSSFINMSQFSILWVRHGPYDFRFGWLARWVCA
jgi:hypothetical protein